MVYLFSEKSRPCEIWKFYGHTTTTTPTTTTTTRTTATTAELLRRLKNLFVNHGSIKEEISTEVPLYDGLL